MSPWNAWMKKKKEKKKEENAEMKTQTPNPNRHIIICPEICSWILWYFHNLILFQIMPIFLDLKEYVCMYYNVLCFSFTQIYFPFAHVILKLSPNFVVTADLTIQKCFSQLSTILGSKLISQINYLFLCTLP